MTQDQKHAVSQEAREAAADYCALVETNPNDVRAVREGYRDGTYIVQAFAKFERDLAGREGVFPDGAPCRFVDCPPGLFTWSGLLCFKSEYSTKPGQQDAYCCDSGEYFWGGTNGDLAARRELVVQPVTTALASEPAPSERESLANKLLYWRNSLTERAEDFREVLLQAAIALRSIEPDPDPLKPRWCNVCGMVPPSGHKGHCSESI